MVKKSQAALEFLMTYGWAFLVILVMIGALAYFGVLNPSKLMPEKCLFGPPMMCNQGDLAINNEDIGTVVFRVMNNKGSSIKVFGAEATTDFAGGCTGAVICVDSADSDCNDAGEGIGGANNLQGDSANAYIWGEGAAKKVVVDCTGGSTLPEGEKIKFTFAMNWFSASSEASYATPVTGQLYSSVQ